METQQVSGDSGIKTIVSEVQCKPGALKLVVRILPVKLAIE